MLACFSGILDFYLPIRAKSRILTLGIYPIDAYIGAQLVLYLLTKDNKYIQLVANKLSEYLAGRTSPLLLYFSEREFSYFLTALIIAVIIAIVITLLSALLQKLATAAQEAASSWLSMLFSKFSSFFGKVVRAGQPLSAAVYVVFGGFYSLATMLTPAVQKAWEIFIHKLNWIEWLILIGILAFETIVLILTGRASLAQKIFVNLAIALTNVFTIFLSDYLDTDGDPTMSPLEAISKIYA